MRVVRFPNCLESQLPEVVVGEPDEDEGGGGSSRRWITIPPTAPPQAAPALLHICNLLHCTAIQVDVTPGLLVNMPCRCNV